MRPTTKCSKLTLVVFIFIAASLCLAQEPKPAGAPEGPRTEPTSKLGESKSSDEAKASIYFYRIKQFAGSALEPSVYCDDKELARLDNGRYFRVSLDPEKHTCSMGDKQ